MLKFTELAKPRIDIELYGTDTYIPPIDKVGLSLFSSSIWDIMEVVVVLP